MSSRFFSLIPHLYLLGFGLLPLAQLKADHWPCWRGPGGVGVSAAKSVPTKLTKDHIVWTWSDPGLGHSSPVIFGDTLFLTTAKGQERLLVCLDPHSGRENWRRTVLTAPPERKHKKNSYASTTPAADGKRVYVSFLGADNKVVAAAYDFQGREIWRKSPGKFFSMHGFCSTPVLFDDLVILNCDQDAYAYLVAFDRRDGSIRWKTHRENEVRSYCPPTVFRIDGKPQMILSGSETVASYDPHSGKRIWVCDGPTEQCVASVVYGKGLVFVTGGFPDRHFLAIDPRGRGDVTDTHIRWRHHRRGVSYVPSPLYHDGHFYVVADETGVLTALEAESGRYVKQRRLRGSYSASLLYAAGKIYAFSEGGHVTIVRAGPELEILEEWEFDAPIYATAAVAHGRLYLRSWTTLYAFRGEKS